MRAGVSARLVGKLACSDVAPLGAAVARVEYEPADSPRPVSYQPLATVAAAPDGTLRLGPLFPRFRYRLRLSAAGCADLELGPRELAAGESWDLGAVTLTRAGAIRGRVVDLEGQAVAGATVTALNGPAGASTISDRQGQFSLGSAYAGEGWVTARKAGYYLGGARAAGGAEGVSMPLCPVGRTAPWAGQPLALPAALPAEEARGRALRVYEQAAQGLAGCPGAERWWGGLLEALAAVDPDQALGAAAHRGTDTQMAALIGVATGLRDRDPEAAPAVLEALPGNWAAHDQVQLARHVAADHPEVARRALAEVVRRATQAPGGSAPVRLALAGEAYLDLGDRAAGEDALNRAAALVATLGAGDTDTYERGVVAAALARVDVDRALQLMAAIRSAAGSNRNSIFEYSREMINLAGRVARTDLPRALRIMQDPQATGPYGGEWIVRLAGEAAGNDPQGALKLLAEAEWPTGGSGMPPGAVPPAAPKKPAAPKPQAPAAPKAPGPKPPPAGLTPAAPSPGVPHVDPMEVLAGYVSVAWRTAESDPAMARAAVARVRELAGRTPARSWYRSPRAALLAAAYLGARCGDPDPRSLLLGPSR